MTDSNRFVPFFDIYFKIYFICGLILQIILLILIFTKSPQHLAKLKYFLLNTCILQIISIFCGYFTQHRTLSNVSENSMAVLSTGPCHDFGPEACFAGYHVFLGIGFCVGLGLSNTVAFRYTLMHNYKVKGPAIFVRIFATHLISTVVVIIPFTSKWNFEKVRNNTYLDHPSYNLSIYEPFGGFCDVNSFQFLIATILLFIGAYAIPIVSAILSRSIFKLIAKHQTMSTKNKLQAKTLVKGLSFQTLLPSVCYIPLPLFYGIAQITNEEILLTEHLLGILICLPSLLDPFISFYFIIPYRKAIKSAILFWKKAPATSVASIHVINCSKFDASYI